MKEIDENQIYDDSKGKGPLCDVGLRFSRQSANDLAEGWREKTTAIELFGQLVTTKVHHRRIKVDGVSYPVFMVIARAKRNRAAQ